MVVPASMKVESTPGSLADTHLPASGQAFAVAPGLAPLEPAAPPRELSVLILDGDFPVFPSGAGHEYLNTRNLADFAGAVGLVSMAHDQQTLDKARLFERDRLGVYLWTNPAIGQPAAPPTSVPVWIERLHAALRSTLQRIELGRRLPGAAYDAALAFRNMSGALTRALSERPWDVFVVVQSSAAAAVDYIPEQAAKVLVMHDIRSVVLERQASLATSMAERSRLRSEARRFFEFERRYAQRYDLLIAMSEHDAAWLRANYSPKAVAAVPIPVDGHHYSPNDAITEAAGRIVFTGMMSHGPNVDAAVYFARKIFPIIRAERPGTEFFVVGKTPTREIEDLRSLPGVFVTGEVPDTRPYLAAAAVVVVPIRYGSGVRNKILEAWSMEKCVVSTTIGAEGLEYQSGRDILIADGAPEFAREVVRALDDPRLRKATGIAGRRIAALRHDPATVANRYYCAARNAAAAQNSSSPMRIALDVRWMLPGRAGGIENQARAFVDNLLEADSFNEYTLIVPSAIRFDIDRRRSPRVRVVCHDSMWNTMADAAWRTMASLHRRLHLDYWQSPDVRRLRNARALEADIAYSFTGFVHPDLHPLRNVLMVPDIQHEYHPEFFSSEAIEERRRIYTDSICRADHLCPASEFTRNTLIERFAVDPAKITVIPLAADPMFTPARCAGDAAIASRYGLEPGRYLFFPGHTWKHKNHRAAIAALPILRDRYGVTPQLVCTGGAREAQSELEAEIEARGLRNQVRFLGYCPRSDMPALYRSSAALVFPSIFEGFGIPVVEAMACGVPVVCSNRASLPETAGDAAMLVSPDDPDTLADAIHAVLSDPGLRRDMIERGFRQASKFSWRRHTLDTIAVLRRVHDRSRFAGAAQ